MWERIRGAARLQYRWTGELPNTDPLLRSRCPEEAESTWDLYVSREGDDIDEEESSGGRPGIPLDPRRVARILWKGKTWIVLVAVLTAGLGYALGKYAVHHTFESASTLRYVGLPGQALHEIQRDLPALVAVAYTDGMLARLRDDQGLYGVTLDGMRHLVGVHSDPGTGIVTFSAFSDSAEGAAGLANSMSEVFLAHHEERRREELGDLVSSLQERIDVASAELLTARETYNAFREANGITDLTAEQESIIAQTSELRSRADLAGAEVEAIEARVAQLQGTLEATPRTQTVTGGRSRQQTRLAELRQRLREARGQGLGDAHPQVRSLQRQVASLQRASGEPSSEGPARTTVSGLYEQIRSSLAEAEAEAEATRHRQETLEQLAVAAQERSNRFSTIEGQAGNLLAQVTVKEALVERLTTDRAEAEDQVQDVPTGFRVVNPAAPPENAVPTKRKLMVAAGVPAVSLLLLLLVLLGRGLKGLKLQTPAEVAWWGKGPVVGTSTWPEDPNGLFDLLADMDDMTESAQGTLLVVGASERERKLARRLAFEMGQDWGETTLLENTALPALPSGMPPDMPGPQGVALDLTMPESPIPVGVEAATPPAHEGLTAVTWSDATGSNSLRRAARRADGVLVVVASDMVKASELAKLRKSLGRDDGVAFLLVGVSEEVAKLSDRTGPVEEFWTSLAG